MRSDRSQETSFQRVTSPNEPRRTEGPYEIRRHGDERRRRTSSLTTLDHAEDLGLDERRHRQEGEDNDVDCLGHVAVGK